MNDDHDPILDACLDEVLGSRVPPDLSDRVLREWSQRQARSTAEAHALPDPLLPPVCVSPPLNPQVSLRTVHTEQAGAPRVRAGRDWRITAWASAALALGLIVLVATMGVLVRRDRERGTMQTSQQAAESTPVISRPPTVDRPNNLNSGSSNAPQLVIQPSVPAPISPANSSVSKVPGTAVETPPAIPAFAEQGRLTIDRLIASTQIPAPLPDTAVVSQINVAIRKLWSRHELSPPAPISDAAWRQRVFLVVLGREPTDADHSRFGKTSSAEQRAKMVNSLMTSEPFLEEFARHWSEYLTGVFLPDDSLDNSSLVHREGMLQYFRRALLDGRPFDRVTEELLTATGSGLPGATDYNGAANFLLARGDGKFERGTADTARLFLGRNVECQQCHDDLGGGNRRQREFWELNAFYRQLVVVRDIEAKTAKLTNSDFLGEDNKDGHNAIVFFEQPDGLLKSAFPAFSGQSDLPRSGLLAEVNRRELLAQCVTTSPEFRQAVTNRLWAAVCGSGLAPVEDLSSADSPSRELLGELADQFAAHQFNPRQVIAWAVLSEPFAVPSSDHSLSMAARGPALFHRFNNPRPVVHRPVHESLLTAAKNFGQNAVSSTTSAKIDQTPPTTTKNGKIALEPSNAKSLFDMTPASADPLVRKVLANPRLTSHQKAEHLFQLVLHRQPKRRELDVVEKLLEKAGDRPETAWNSVWSALHESVP